MQFRLITLFAITLCIAVMLGLVRVVAQATGWTPGQVLLVYLLASVPLLLVLGFAALSRVVAWSTQRE